MDVLEIFARPGEEKALESIVADADPDYRKYVNFHNLGETVFVARGGPELVVLCMVNGASSVSKGVSMTGSKLEARE